GPCDHGRGRPLARAGPSRRARAARAAAGEARPARRPSPRATVRPRRSAEPGRLLALPPRVAPQDSAADDGDPRALYAPARLDGAHRSVRARTDHRDRRQGGGGGGAAGDTPDRDAGGPRGAERPHARRPRGGRPRGLRRRPGGGRARGVVGAGDRGPASRRARRRGGRPLPARALRGTTRLSAAEPRRHRHRVESATFPTSSGTWSVSGRFRGRGSPRASTGPTPWGAIRLGVTTQFGTTTG